MRRFLAEDRFFGIILLAVVEGGEIDRVPQLLQDGASLTERDKDGRTALLCASAYCEWGIVKLLYENGASLHAQDNTGRTALMYAAAYGEEAVVKWLLDSGVYLAEKDQIKRAFLCAAEHGRAQVMELILKENPDFVDAQNEVGRKALSLAAGNGYVESVQVLLRKNTSLTVADEYGGIALLIAAEYVYVETVKWLLENTNVSLTERDNNGRTALIIAVGAMRLRIVELLLQYGASVNAEDNEGRTALSIAKDMGYDRSSRLATLLQHMQRESEQLFRAASLGDLTIVRSLLRKCTSLNEKNKDGRTPLMCAAYSGQLKMVRYLLQKGADLTEIDGAGCTLLLLAAKSGCIKMVKCLLRNTAASLTERDNNGCTALLLAAFNGDLELAKWLVYKRGVSLSEYDNEGRTALLHAANNGQLKMVEWLLHNGASLADACHTLGAMIQAEKPSPELIQPLVTRIVRERMQDPYDNNYQKLATAAASMTESLTMITDLPLREPLEASAKLLDRYNTSISVPSDSEVVIRCGELQKITGDDKASQQSQALAISMTPQIIMRQNQAILASNSSDRNTEQAWFEELRKKQVSAQAKSSVPVSDLVPIDPNALSGQLEIVELVLDTLHAFNFELEALPAIRDAIINIKKIATDGFTFFDAKETAESICKVLQDSGIEALQGIAKNYLPPIIYLLDPNPEAVAPPLDAAGPITEEQLRAVKWLHKVGSKLYQEYKKDPISVETLAPVLAEALYGAMVLTGQDVKIFSWLSKSLAGLKKYVDGKADELQQWVDHLVELDKLINRAVYDERNGYLHAARQSILEVVKKILLYTTPDYANVIEEKSGEILSDIENFVDVSSLPHESWMRYQPLLVLAAAFYEREGQGDVAKKLLLLSSAMQLLHQLSAARSVDDFKKIFTSFEPKSILELFDYIVGFSEPFKKSAWYSALAVFVSIIKYIVSVYPLSDLERLKKLKEFEANSHMDDLGKNTFRLLASAQCFPDLQAEINKVGSDNRTVSTILPIVLKHFLKPMAIIWERHEVTASVVLLPKVIDVASRIDSNNITPKSIENVLRAMQGACADLDELKKYKLLDAEDSYLYAMVMQIEDYLNKGVLLARWIDFFRNIRALDFLQGSLNAISAKGGVLADMAGALTPIRDAVFSGDSGRLKEAVTTLSTIVQKTAGVAETAGQTGMSLGTAVASAVNPLALLSTALSFVNVGVTVYYGQKISAKIDKLSLTANEANQNVKIVLEVVQSIQSEVYQLSQAVDQGFSRMDEGFSSVQKKLGEGFSLFNNRFDDVIKHQEQIYRKLDQRLQNLQAAVQAGFTQESLEGRLFKALEISDQLSTAVKYGNFYFNKLEVLDKFYGKLLHENTGMCAPTLNASGNPVYDRASFFLAPLFNQPLPNLYYWVKFCLILNSFLIKFKPFDAELRGRHEDVIKITKAILNALQGITSKGHIIALLNKCHTDPTEEDYKHVTKLAEVCGLPLHQFGEVGFTLWDPSVADNGQGKKSMLEDAIIKAYEHNFNESNLTPCSRYILSVEKLVNDLENVGREVFSSSLAALPGLPLAEAEPQQPLRSSSRCSLSLYPDSQDQPGAESARLAINTACENSGGAYATHNFS